MKRLTIVGLILVWAGSARADTFLPILSGADPEGEAVRIQVVESVPHATTLDIEVHGLFVGEVSLEDGTYTTLCLREGRVSTPGKPEVPFVSRFLAIPRDAVPFVEVVSDERVVVDGVRVAPVQQKPKRCGPGQEPPRFVCDRTIYDGKVPYPTDLVVIEEVGVMRDMRYARIRVNVVQFDPYRDRIIVHARVRLRVRHHGTRFFGDFRLSPTFEALYRRTFVNYNALRLRDKAVPAVERILILAPEVFAVGAEAFADFKRRQGFRADVVFFSGQTNKTIKEYLQSQYNDPTTRPTYVVLVGDVQKMPTNHGIGGCASDFKYSLLDGDDLVSDVLVSRFSVKDEQDLLLQVGKVIWYESSIGTDASWLSASVCISSSEGEGTSNDDYRSDIICGIQKDYGYYPVNKLYESNGGNTAGKVSGALNAGRGWITYLGHGSGTSWVNTHPEFSISHVNQLKNQGKILPVVDISCDNGAFDQYETCFAEAWMRANQKGQPTGAVAIYSASTPAYWDEPAEMAIGMTKAFLQQGVHRWGEVAFSGRAYLAQVFGIVESVQETFEQYILFGDASMLLRSRAPVELVVSGPFVIPVGEVEETFTVTRPNGAAVERALVHIFREGDVDVAGYTDAKGMVTLGLAAETPGKLEVVVTAFDAVPWVGDVSVVITGCGIIKVKPSVARCEQTLAVTLWDRDLNQNPLVKEQAVVTAQHKVFVPMVLTETTPDSGQFTGTLDPIAAGLQPEHGAVLTVRYQDADCNGASAIAEARATWDCRSPAIFDIEVSNITSSSARIRWRTDEPSAGRVLLGPLGQSTPYPSPGFGMEHEVALQGLSPSTHYVYHIEAVDGAGNVSVTPTEGSFDTPACTPDCKGKACGPDGCGGSCGSCGPNQECNAKGQCFGGAGCEPQWSPGCGGCKCEACVCAMDPYCCWSAWDFMCVEACMDVCGGCGSCIPACEGKECGPDGCGGSCGTCPVGTKCLSGICQCVPSCAGKECGPDGCGGSCGICQPGQQCVKGHCKCVPSCEGRECGPDGCGSTCGECGADEYCDDFGRCVPSCVADCEGRECGGDGCGGSCGSCGDGTSCVAGKCVCVPKCVGRWCGDDGCGGSCGDCPKGFECVDGRCACIPACEGRECGPDGCGGTCGLCPPGEVCAINGQCLLRPLGDEGGADVPVPDSGSPPDNVPSSGGLGGCSAGHSTPWPWPWLILLALALSRRRLRL